MYAKIGLQAQTSERITSRSLSVHADFKAKSQKQKLYIFSVKNG